MAYLFDGINDKIDHGNITALNSAANLTFTYWYKPTAWTTLDGIFSKGSSCIVMWQYTNDQNLMCQIAGLGYAISAASSFPNGTWAHVALVYDGAGAANADRLKIYNTGTNLTLSFPGNAIGATTGTNATSFAMGFDTSQASYAAFTCANLKIWSASLTAAEVLQDIYSFKPVVQRSSLLLWSPYAENGTPAADYSGNGNHGTITEAALAAGPPQLLMGEDSLLLAPRAGRILSRSKWAGKREFGPLIPLYQDPS